MAGGGSSFSGKTFLLRNLSTLRGSHHHARGPPSPSPSPPKVGNSAPPVHRVAEPGRRATSLVVFPDELTVDASVAPGRVLVGHPQYQGPDRLRGGWAARLASRVGPAAGNQSGVPAQQGSR